MTRRDLSLTIALCASLVVHGVLALVTFEGARRQLAIIRLPGFQRQLADAIEVDSPDEIRLGGMADEGLAPNASPGDENIRAKDAPVDQAWLSRDPQGLGRIGDAPSDSLAPQSDSVIDAVTALAIEGNAVRILPDATEVPQPFGAGPGAVVLVPPRSKRNLSADAARAQPVSNKPAADPAIMSPSESDAFSTLGGVEFRDGRMESRMGRAFKSVRPHLSLAAQIDLMSLADRRIVLKIAIDANGRVTNVDVMRSTGSDLVDQPVKLAMYQWWFEPAKGPNGRAMAETIVFPIRWH